jgi:protein SCO1/2
MNHHAKPFTTTCMKHRAPWSALAMSAALGLLLALSACAEPAAKPPLQGADIGGEFELANTAGETVRWGDFDGQYRIVYFGYAYCPDICPTDMQRMTQGLAKFADAEPDLAARIQPIFITIDPERDTPEVVDEFTHAFSDKVIGLTGTPAQIKAAADTFRVYYSRGEDAAGGSYLMNHSNIVYLFGPAGEPLATLPADEGADAVAAEIAKWVS